MPLTIQIDNLDNINFSTFYMPMVTVYKNPTDFPDKYVARIFDIKDGRPLAQPYALIKDSLEEIHKVIPDQFIRMPRDPQDDPKIQEVWI